MDTGLKKYSSILLKGSAAISMAQASTKFIGLLLLPLFTHYLSPEDYGVFSMVTLTMTVLALIYNPGMMSATVRLYHATDCEEERKLLLGSAHRFFLFVPIVPVIIGLLWGPKIFSWLFSDFDFYPFGLLAIVLAFFIQPTRVWTMLLTLKYKIYITALFNAISVVGGMLVTVLLVVVFNMGAKGMVLGLYPGTIFLFIISLVTLKKYTSGAWSLQNIKKQLVFGLPIVVSVWASVGLDLVGRYQLEKMTDMHNVGIYSFGIVLASVPMFLVQGIKELWSPIFYENMNKKEYKTISELVKYFVGGLTILVLTTVLFSKEAIILLVNERFYAGIPIIGFLVLGIYFNGLLTISNSLLGFNNRFGIISVFSAIAVVLNIVLNIILIPIIGVLGAAVALAVSYFSYFALGAWHQRKTLILIQKKGTASIPILITITVSFLVFILNQVYAVNQVSLVEVMIKSGVLLFAIFLFVKLKFFSKIELVYAYKTFVNLIHKK